MLPPDLEYMVHTTDRADEDGYFYRGSKLTAVTTKGNRPPEWRSRTFAFAAFSGEVTGGLRPVQLGNRSLFVFASHREHTEEVVVFRRQTDTRKRWDEDEIGNIQKVGQDAYLMIRLSEVDEDDTPLNKPFWGEWGYWESFFVPVIDEQQAMESLRLLDPEMCEDFFLPQRLPVQVSSHQSVDCLKMDEELKVRYEVKVVLKELETWADLLHLIGDDMRLLKDTCVEHKHLRKGDELLSAFTEHGGRHDHCKRNKRDLGHMKLPVIASFDSEIFAKDWDSLQDMISLQYKYTSLSELYTGNYGGGYSSQSGSKSDPWCPHARLALSALTKTIARHSDIRSVMDVGCGDMAWMRFFLEANPHLSYVGVDMLPYALTSNFRRSPRLQFIQTDLSNLQGVEVLPEGVDLVFAKDIFNHMVAPDAVNAIKRIVALRPRFILTHIHTNADNLGWERRIDKHLHYTKYDYSKPPFALPFPTTVVSKMAEDAYYVLYEIVPPGANPTPARIEDGRVPTMFDPQEFSIVRDGQISEPLPCNTKVPSTKEFHPPTRVPEKTIAAPVITDLPQELPPEKAGPTRLPIQGIPAVEFRARCDLIFTKYDHDRDEVLVFEEVRALMDAGGRNIDDYEAYKGLCEKLKCDPRTGLQKKDVYNLLQKAPKTVWEEIWRTVNPLSQMVRRGAAELPETTLERPITDFLFRDGLTDGTGEERHAKILLELNVHLFYGAQDIVKPEHCACFFGKQRLEVHIIAPTAFDLVGDKGLCCWKLVIAKLSAEVIPEDCTFKLEDIDGRFGSKRMTIKLMKAEIKKWYKAGLPASGVNTGSIQAG